MKLSTKPISSPGRPDKFPPPLMRFLRTNAGNKSRGSSRSRSSSSPMFLRKKNKNNTTTIETQEPSSPKVTCMGQVRVRRAAASARAPTKCHRDFWWLPNALFCHHKIKSNSSSYSSCSCCHWKCKPVWPNWWFLFRRKASKVTESSTKTEHKELENENRVNVNPFVSNFCSSMPPPREALLLTRCRSAPYRSSSLASRFWGSPLRNEEETGEEQGTEIENRERESTERPSLKRESVLEQEGRKDAKLERKLRFFKELEESLRERIMESEKVRELKRMEEEEEGEGDYAAPLVLTRCKSEPARTGEKLDPAYNQKRELMYGAFIGQGTAAQQGDY